MRAWCGQELDFRNEARNAVTFGKSLVHLGYVRVPRTVDKYSTGPRVLVSEWVYGRHLKDLTKEEQLRLCAMSVEAVTAGLVLTGIVHADPHEGNLMLADVSISHAAPTRHAREAVAWDSDACACAYE